MVVNETYMAEKRAERALALQKEREKAAEARRKTAASSSRTAAAEPPPTVNPSYIREKQLEEIARRQKQKDKAPAGTAASPVRRKPGYMAAAAEQPPPPTAAPEQPPIQRQRQNMAASSRKTAPPTARASASSSPTAAAESERGENTFNLAAYIEEKALEERARAQKTPARASASSSQTAPPTAAAESPPPPVRRKNPANMRAAAEQPPPPPASAEQPPIQRRRQNMAPAEQPPPPPTAPEQPPIQRRRQNTASSEYAPPPPIRRRPENTAAAAEQPPPPRAAQPPAQRRRGEMRDSPSGSNVVVHDLSPYIKVYRNKRVEKLAGSGRVNSSEHRAVNGVLSKDVTISKNVSARVYCPAAVSNPTPPQARVPILVYYHRGGFCTESALSSKTHSYVIQLAAEANAVAVSVEYRVASKNNPLPTAFEDAWEALRWVASHASEQASRDAGHVQKAANIFKTGISIASSIITGAAPDLQRSETGPVISWLADHGDFSRLLVGGDGAGGTIAHYVSLQAGNNVCNTELPLAEGVNILGTILCFPYFLEESTEEESIAYRLWMYLCPEGAHDDHINPFGPHYHSFKFKKMFVCYGERDPLRNVAANFVDEMKRSEYWKGEVIGVEKKGRGHCFQVEAPNTPQAKDLIKDIASFINGSP